MARGFSKTDNLTKDTLLKIAMAGILVIAVTTSPFAMHQIVKGFFKDKIKEIQRKRARKLKELKKKKIISFQELEDGSIKIELTHQGKTLVRQYKLDDIKINKPLKWDRKWRLIIYDIPHQNKKARDALREKLKSWHLYQLQKSVWVSPYDCLSEIEFLCGVFDINLNEHIYYLIIQEIPKEEEIKKWFNLI